MQVNISKKIVYFFTIMLGGLYTGDHLGKGFAGDT